MGYKYIMQCREHTPRKAQTFWCNQCDSNQVDSTQADTGKFFVSFGHAYDYKSQLYDGDYHGVMFAICTSCIAAPDDD